MRHGREPEPSDEVAAWLVLVILALAVAKAVGGGW